MSSDFNKATVRTLEVLSAVVARPGSHGVSELAADLGMTKTMVHRALATLEAETLIVRDPSGYRYQLGYGVLALAPAEAETASLVELARPFLQELNDLTAETITLAVRQDDSVVYAASIQGRSSVSDRASIGRVVPIHGTIGGLAVLAFLPEAEREELLSGDLVAVNLDTTTDRAALRDRLHEVRESGVAISWARRDDLAGFSYPVIDRGGQAIASITISGPAERFADDRIRELIEPASRIVHQLDRKSRLLPRRVPIR